MKIIDVIELKHPYSKSNQIMVVVEDAGRVKYTRHPVPNPYSKPRYDRGDLLVGHCDDKVIWNFYRQDPGSRDAFAGREFGIQMADGSVTQAKGDYWDSYPNKEEVERLGIPPTAQIGYATVASLAKCYVFFSGHISLDAINAWLSENEPSHDYCKYDPKHSIDYHVKLIGSKDWDPSVKISPVRARKLRKLGRPVHRKDGQWYRFPVLENWIKQNNKRVERDTPEKEDNAKE